MELTYSELRAKEVINISDGRKLGRISDLVFMYPRCILTGIVVPGCHRGSIFRSTPELFISMSCIVKIGEDVILVDLKKAGNCAGSLLGNSYQGGGLSQEGSLYTSGQQNNSDSEKVQNLKDIDDFE
jgi:YlmC/YmxH family sporulation protein